VAEFYLMPAISPTMELGTLVSWRLQEGQGFESSTVLADIGTDKANMEAEIFEDGVLLKHLVSEGDEIPPGYPIAIWGEAGDEDIAALLEEFQAKKQEAASPPAEQAEPPAPEPAQAAPAKSSAPVTRPAAPAEPTPEREWMGQTLSRQFMDPPGDIRAGSRRRIVASPLAKKIASDLGIALERVRGTGPGGRILRADVESAPTGGTGRAPMQRADEVIRNSPMRKTIARRLLESSQGIPAFYLSTSFDVGGFVELRKQFKAGAPQFKFSYNDMLVKAVALALTEHPEVNASWSDDAITHHGRVDVGVAVALGDGLITPVVRGADAKAIWEIGDEVRELAGRAKTGKLDVSEYTNGTFTISNLGMMDIEHFTAIINPPEAAILAVGAVEQVPVVVDGALSTGWRMKVTMTCDHRVLDGAVGASFLQTLRKYVEQPFLLLV
jgi:pyruvate dehydrogenase E2 component (dihydrolipoamide acetyltransferase)